jgi:RNA polymerase sigma-70 factor (ECF subfamily)
MDSKKLSIQDLLQLCLATQDPALWQELNHRVQPLISRVVVKTVNRCRWVSPDPALVDDLIQDTFVKLFANDCRALREFQFEHENSFFGFLKTVASNVAQDYLRREYSPKHGGDLEEEDLDKISTIVPARTSFADDTHAQILIAEIQRCLEQELAHEPNFSRDIAIFWLYYRFGLTAKAISQIPSIGLTVKGVESTLLRLTRLVRARCLGGPDRKSAFGG